MFWKEKLTHYDSELCMMVESLTGKPCEPKNGGDEGYFITVDYSAHNSPEYVSAIMDAVLGRIGDRLINLKDNADAQNFLVQVKYSTDKYPGIIRATQHKAPDINAGSQYIVRNSEIVAIEVLRTNVGQLVRFVGNGEMEIEKRPDGNAVFHFLNAAGGVWQHAPEFSYIVNDGSEHFIVMDAETFNEKYVLR